MAIVTANLQCNLDSTNPASNTGSGNTWYDLSANNIDFTGTGTSRVTYNGINVFELGTGKYFTGPNNLSSVVNWDGNWTVELWIYRDGSQLGSFTSEWGTGYSYPTNTGFNLQSYNPSPQSRSYFGYATGSYEITTNPASTLVIPSNVLSQVVVRKSGTTIQYLLNGVPSYSKTGISNSISLTSDPFYIGYGGFYDPMVGKVAILRVYDTDLSNAEVLQNYNSLPLPNKVISYDISDPASYSGTGNTVYDLTVNNNDIQIYNGPVYAGSTQAKYLEFDGSNDYATGFGFTGLSSGNVFSRNYWLQLNSTAAQQWASSLGYYYSPSFAVSEDLIDTGGQWKPNYGANVSQINDGILSTGQWINLTYVSNGSVLEAYVNGGIAGTFTGNSKALTPSDFGLCIGGYIDKYSGSPNWNNGLLFNGKFAIYEIYDGALDSAQVNNLYLDYLPRFIPSPEFKLVSTDITSYPGTGNTWFDISGNNNDWTFTNVPSYSGGYFNYVCGLTDVSLTSANPYANLTGTNVQMSLEFWIYIDSSINYSNDYRVLFNNDNGSSTGFAQVWERPNASGGVQGANIHFAYNNSGSLYNSGTYFSANDQWIHLVMVRSGSNYKVYQDGIQVQNNTLSSADIKTSTAAYASILGNTLDNRFGFDGKLAQVSAYSYALSAGEVLALYNEGLPTPPPTPTPYAGNVGGRTFGSGFAG